MSNTTLADTIFNYDNAWLDLVPGDLDPYEMFNPLIHRSTRDIERPDLHLLRLLRNPKYFGIACKLLFDINLLPMQVAILQELWGRPFPMYIASRGFGKSFMLALYATLKCVLIPGTKVVIVGAAFRQSKVIFDYMETIWQNAPIMRNMFTAQRDGPRKEVDKCTMNYGESWAIAIPLGDGSKIRGLRAHTIIADEFASISPEIYETVVSGFTSVSAHPVDNVMAAAKRKAMKKDGIWDNRLEEVYKLRGGNQSIVAGTADYEFKHFASYWKRYKKIIESRGDKKILEEIFGDNYNDSVNWKDYAIIRIPYELIPEGFMDDKQVTRSKATIHSGIYNMEYGAVFVRDSQGFFKRSLIESCVGTDIRPIRLPSGDVWFDPMTRGFPDRRYVYGIDPASEKDNFSITVLELHQDHTRIVYGWTTNKKDFQRRLEAGLATEHDFYGYCARKIRELMKTFPPVKIGMDAQGGGIAVEEALHDIQKLQPGELPLWRVIIPDKEQPNDDKPGLHILEMIQFADGKWTADANHGLRKDMEDKVLIFPRFDSVTIGLALEADAEAYRNGDKTRMYDTLDDCVMEIEELKNELSIIVQTTTPNGTRDKWDTPEIKAAGGKKGRIRKDRYSSLVIANMVARQIHRADAPIPYTFIGGLRTEMNVKSTGVMYNGPDWFTSGGDIGQICQGVSR